LSAGRRRLKTLALALLLAAGMLLSVSIDQGTNPSGGAASDTSALDPADFSIELHRGKLVLSGFTASAKHEQALARIIAEEFGTSEPTLRYRPGVLLSDDWVPVTTQLLSAFATTQSASATVTEHAITIRGVSSMPGPWYERLNALRNVSPEQMRIDHDVVIIDDASSLSTLCERAFAQSLGSAIEFRQSSVEIRTSSYVTLDRVVEVANDCRTGVIAIRGHSDATGDEAWNRQLSRARAQAVADQLIARGIDAGRFVVAGLGSSQPVADNSTAVGRGLNRRIEFELLQSSL